MSTPVATPASPPAPAAVAAAPLSGRRRAAVWTLIVLASLIALVSTLTAFVNRQMLDNHAWRKASTDVIQDPAVQSALATYMINQLYSNVDVAAALQERLPKNLKSLGPPIAGALQQPATQGVEFLLQRPRFQQLWINASSLAQEKLVNVLENKTGYGISTGNGVVTLNVHELIVQLGTELGLPASALAKLPQKAGTVTLMRSDQLSAAQAGVQAVRIASTWLLVLVLVMYGAAIYIARGARRTTLRNVGWAFLLVGLVVLIIRRLVGNYITDSLASPGYNAATHHLWLIGTAILGQIGAAEILYGAIFVLAAAFAGPTAIATRMRRAVAPVLNERQGIVWTGVAGVYLLAVLWGGTHALRTWWGIILLAALIAAGVVALRRQTLREFPMVAGAAAQPPVHERLAAAGRARMAGGAAAAAAAPGEGQQRSAAEEIARLRDLRDSGAITEEEYEQGKKLALT